MKQISKEQTLTYLEIDQICMNEKKRKTPGADSSKEIETVFPGGIYKKSDGRNNLHASCIMGRK